MTQSQFEIAILRDSLLAVLILAAMGWWIGS